MVNFWFRKSTGIRLAGSAATRWNCGRKGPQSCTGCKHYRNGTTGFG